MIACLGISVVAALFVAVIFEETLLCRPISLNWDTTPTGGTCGDGDAAYVATGVVNVLTDVLVICLPVPQIWKLQMPVRTKVVLSILFSFGLMQVTAGASKGPVTMLTSYRICVITIVRLSSKTMFYWTAADPTFTIWKIMIWSQLEPNIAIVCACVPLLRPIFGNYFGSHRSRGYSGSKQLSGTDRSGKGIRMDTPTRTYEGQGFGGYTNARLNVGGAHPHGRDYSHATLGGTKGYNASRGVPGGLGNTRDHSACDLEKARNEDCTVEKTFW
ncbi:uncharacterized protein KY384_006112 [Bacidia gigantensis]|uniref:uncharacterized protein n=1 Tax=Bacidia gigantensis TaxID=2732470 RepID=UPI001D04A54F|nr:uncharacterized protein KY384_006112 [Bacidia gigantensis]KAG8529475.1 hypothetical protein KY384_006112 [Bacidia gigantensis]